MRLLLDLKATKDAAYDLKYFNKAHGFVYNLLRGTPYAVLHNKAGYKFFCFSNIFPIGDIKTGDIRKFIISSPDSAFVKMLHEKISAIGDINIGELSFRVESSKLLELKIRNNMKLITTTPIIIRIPKSKYETYGIRSLRPYVYWESCHPFEAFIKQIEENLFKKYKEFYKKDIEEFQAFEQFEHVKDVPLRITIKGEEIVMKGSKWIFIFSGLEYSKQRRDLLQFALDAGLGERNTYGFGFVNVVR